VLCASGATQTVSVRSGCQDERSCTLGRGSITRVVVAQAFDFASITKKVGAPSFAYFAKGGYYEL
jgi:hypothetical protein